MLNCFNANKAVRRSIFGRCSNLDKCRLEAAGDVVSGTFVGPIFLDKCVKFRDPSLDRAGAIPPEAVGALFSTAFSL